MFVSITKSNYKSEVLWRGPLKSADTCETTIPNADSTTAISPLEMNMSTIKKIEPEAPIVISTVHHNKPVNVEEDCVADHSAPEEVSTSEASITHTEREDETCKQKWILIRSTEDKLGQFCARVIAIESVELQCNVFNISETTGSQFRRDGKAPQPFVQARDSNSSPDDEGDLRHSQG